MSDVQGAQSAALDFSLSEAEVKGLLKRRAIVVECEKLARDFQLGSRAKEVLVCLAMGYTAPEIEEELFMSRGTVNTHVRRIYQRLGIHKRTELLALVSK